MHCQAFTLFLLTVSFAKIVFAFLLPISSCTHSAVLSWNLSRCPFKSLRVRSVPFPSVLSQMARSHLVPILSLSFGKVNILAFMFRGTLVKDSLTLLWVSMKKVNIQGRSPQAYTVPRFQLFLCSCIAAHSSFHSNFFCVKALGPQ